MIKLCELEHGKKGIIAKVTGNRRFLSRITSVGLTIGCQIEMIRNEKKYPLLLYSRDSMIALNRNESANIMVEVPR